MSLKYMWVPGMCKHGEYEDKQCDKCEIEKLRADVVELREQLDAAGDGDTWRATAKRYEDEIERLQSQVQSLSTPDWYWDDNDLERAIPADEVCENCCVGDIVPLRPIHELPTVNALVTEDGILFFKTLQEAQQEGGVE